MDLLKTLLAYMATTLMVAVESTSTPAVTPVPTPAPTPETAIVETVTVTPAMAEESAVPTVSVTPVPVPTITPNMKGYHNLAQGARGEDVKKLQERLIELGYLPEGSADGAYGGQTRNAVRRFQYYNGLTVDGIAGRTTQTNLFENPEAAPYPTAEPTAEPTETTEPAAETAETDEAEPAAETAETDEAEPAAEAAETDEAETAAETAEKSEAEPAAETAEKDEAESAAETAETDEAEPAAETTETDEAEPAAETAETDEAEPTVEKTETEEAEPAAETAETDEAEPVAETAETDEAEPATETETESETEQEETDEVMTEPEEPLEEVNLDAEETTAPPVSAEPEPAYEDLAGWIVLNESGAPMQWTELADGVPVVRSPRMQRAEEDIRVSLDDLCKSVEGWVLTEEEHSLVLEAQGFTLAMLREEAGPASMVDGLEMVTGAYDFSFEEGHFIRVDFLARALDGSWAWDQEEETLMLRIPEKDSSYSD